MTAAGVEGENDHCTRLLHNNTHYFYDTAVCINRCLTISLVSFFFMSSLSPPHIPLLSLPSCCTVTYIFFLLSSFLSLWFLSPSVEPALLLPLLGSLCQGWRREWQSEDIRWGKHCVWGGCTVRQSSMQNKPWQSDESPCTNLLYHPEGVYFCDSDKLTVNYSDYYMDTCWINNYIDMNYSFLFYFYIIGKW